MISCRILAVMVASSVLAVSAQAAKFGNNGIKGVFSFFLTATGSLVASNQSPVAQTINRVGTMSSDGKGALTGHAVAVLDNGVDIAVVDYNWTGSYTINTDGTGTITINQPAPGDIHDCRDGAGALLSGCDQTIGQEKFAFVLVSGQKETTLALIQTDAPLASPRLFLRGTATSQVVKKSGGGGGFSIF